MMRFDHTMAMDGIEGTVVCMIMYSIFLRNTYTG